MNCEHVCTSDCRREGCHCECPGEFHDSVGAEVEAYNKRVYNGDMPAHSKGVLRSVIEKENKFFDAEPFREDSNNFPVEGMEERSLED